jgi:hypothetical protein
MINIVFLPYLIINISILIVMFPRNSYCLFPSDTIESVNFFGRQYSWQEWDAQRDYLHNLLTHGSWVNAWDTEEDYKPLYNHFCIWSVNTFLLKYITNQCLDAPGMRGDKYLWKSSLLGRPVAPWSPERLCKIMNGRNLLFVGDSLQEEMFYVAISAMSRSLLVPVDQHTNETYIEDLRSEVVNKCDNLCHNFVLTSCEGPVKVHCGRYPSFNISFLKVLYMSPPDDAENKEHAVKLQDPNDWIDRIA